MKDRRTLKEGEKLDISSESSIVFMTVTHKGGELCLDYNNKLHPITEIYRLIQENKKR